MKFIKDKEDRNLNKKDHFEIDFENMIVKRKKRKRKKLNKNIIQLFYLKNFHEKFSKEKNSEKRKKLLEEVAKKIGYKPKQLYKWVWDESEREKQRNKKNNEELKKNNSLIYQEITDKINNLNNGGNYFLSKIFVPKFDNVDEINNLKIWNLKLGFLNKENLMLSRKITKKDK